MKMDPKKFIFILLVIVAAIVIYSETRNNQVEDESYPSESAIKAVERPRDASTTKELEITPIEGESKQSVDNNVEPQDKLKIPIALGEETLQNEIEAEATREKNPIKTIIAPTEKGIPWENPYEMPLPRN